MMSPELRTLLSSLCPPTSTVNLTKVTIVQDSVRFQFTATAVTASCPRCALRLSLVHSRDQHPLTDFPWSADLRRLCAEGSDTTLGMFTRAWESSGLRVCGSGGLLKA